MVRINTTMYARQGPRIIAPIAWLTIMTICCCAQNRFEHVTRELNTSDLGVGPNDGVETSSAVMI